MNSFLVDQSGGKWHWMVIEWPEVYTINRLEVVRQSDFDINKSGMGNHLLHV